MWHLSNTWMFTVKNIIIQTASRSSKFMSTCKTGFTQVAQNSTFWSNFNVLSEKNKIRFSYEYAHIDSMSSYRTWNSIEQFQWSCDEKLKVVCLILDKLLSSKGAELLENNWFVIHGIKVTIHAVSKIWKHVHKPRKIY